MVRSLCRLLIKVNLAQVTDFNVANMYFNAIRENKIVAKISEFTVPAETGEKPLSVFMSQRLST